MNVILHPIIGCSQKIVLSFSLPVTVVKVWLLDQFSLATTIIEISYFAQTNNITQVNKLQSFIKSINLIKPLFAFEDLKSEGMHFDKNASTFIRNKYSINDEICNITLKQ